MEGLAELRISGQITARVLSELKDRVLKDHIFDGKELNDYAEKLILSKNGKPAFKGYMGFPATICLSINEEIVHGIPFDKKIKKDDLVSIDVGTIYNGWYTDAAISFVVSNNPFSNKEKRSLVKVTKKCLKMAIQRLREGYPDCYLFDIPCAILKATNAKYKIIDELGGHGIGKKLHQDIFIPNALINSDTTKLKIGQAFCIEPMLTMGNAGITKLSNKHVFVTKDGKPSAHFEHTIAITEKGIEVLTELKETK